MTLNELHNAIQAIVYDACMSISLPCIFQNDPTGQSNQGLVAKVLIDTQASQKENLGIEQYRFYGEVVIKVTDEQGQGDKDIMTKIGSLITTFRTANTTDVTFLSPDIFIAGEVDSRYQVNLIVPFRSDHFDE